MLLIVLIVLRPLDGPSSPITNFLHTFVQELDVLMVFGFLLHQRQVWWDQGHSNEVTVSAARIKSQQCQGHSNKFWRVTTARSQKKGQGSQQYQGHTSQCHTVKGRAGQGPLPPQSHVERIGDCCTKLSGCVCVCVCVCVCSACARVSER